MKIKYLLLIAIFTFAVPTLPAQELINAVKSGDIKQVEKVLSAGNIKEMEKEKDEDNYNAYHWTAILGFKDIAELLLENGFNPDYLVTDVPSKDLGKGCILYAGDIMGAPDAAVLAEVNNNKNLVDFYLKQGNTDKHLRTAIMCDNLFVAEKALKAGANPNMTVNMAGERILVPAIRSSLESGSDELIDILVEYGADISEAFANSFIYGNIDEDGEVWEKMLEKGARIDYEYHDGNYNTTPISFASKKDREKLDFLIQHDAESSMK
ncbi:MAG: hypothetical protein J5594_03605 [Elusimicrobiaceae bacterium]|nr:hypothetical protein [Elusimicrobiaceae bacterium]